MNLRRPRHDPSRARVVGRPGRATRTQYRQAVAAYRRVPLKWVGVGIGLAVALTGAFAHTFGANPLLAMGVAAGLLIGADLASRFTSVAATVVVVAVSVMVSMPASMIYVTASGAADPFGALLTLWALLALSGLLAHRTSRGRPWVTTLLVSALVLVAGPFLLMVAPGLGFATAWLLTAAVLFLRGGGWAWLVDQALELGEVVARRRRPADPDTNVSTTLPDPVQGLAAKRAAEEATGALLDTLPAGYTVFHDRTLFTGAALNHLVVGPTGVFLIESQQFKGRISEDPARGLVHARVDVANLLAGTDTAAGRMATAMRLKGVRVAPVVVIHDAVLPAPRARVALSSQGTDLGVVCVLGPAGLVAEVTAGPQVLTARQVRRVAARIDRVCPPATGKPTTPAPPPPVSGAVLDADGQPKAVAPAAEPQPLFVSSTSGLTLAPGQSVTLLTDQGTFTGYEVTGAPVPDEAGVVYVPLADTTRTDGAGVDVWFPLDSVEVAHAPLG